MKFFQRIMFLCLMNVAITTHALDQDIQVELLLSKITNALKENRTEDALLSFEKLESMEPGLNKPLPESFHFYYIEALGKSSNTTKALSRANIYMEKFGKRGKYFHKVIDIMGRLQEKKDKEDKATVERKQAEENAAAERVAAAQRDEIRRRESAELEKENHCKRYREFADKIKQLVNTIEYPKSCADVPSCSRKYDIYRAELDEEKRLCYSH